MKHLIWFAALMAIAAVASACGKMQSDVGGPVIHDITTSGKVLVISDCPATSVTITAEITDESKISQVLLWYRVNPDQRFDSIMMTKENDLYATEVKGADLQDNGYGAMEFYISAEDEWGNKTESPHDTSVQFLPCVSS